MRGSLTATFTAPSSRQRGRISWLWKNWVDEAQGKIFCPGQVTARARQAMFSTRGATYDINQNLIQAPAQVNLYSGENKIIGKSLSYNLDTGNFNLESVQMIFNAEEARELLQEAQTG